MDKVHANECTCCEENCDVQAVAFWPMIDPDIPHHPYCRAHLDDAQRRVLIAFSELNEKK